MPILVPELVRTKFDRKNRYLDKDWADVQANQTNSLNVK